MKRKIKLILAAALAVVCVAGVIAYAMTPLAVGTVEVLPGTATLTFTEQGTYDYDQRHLLYPLVAGEVLEVAVRLGDTVEKGDVIAVVSASDYDHQIRQLESAITGYNGQLHNLTLLEQQEKDTMLASLESLRGQLTTLEAEAHKNSESSESLESQIAIQETIIFQNRWAVSLAKKDLDEARDWGDDTEINIARQAHNAAQNVLSQSELVLEQLKTGGVPEDVYAGQRSALEAQIKVLEDQMGTSYSGGMRQYYSAQIESAQASIAQMSEKAGQAEITAPMAGVISELPVEGQNLTAQQSYVAAIGTGGRVEVYVPVREIDGVHLGDSVELILDKRLGKETRNGTVIEIGAEAVVRLSALGVEERRVRVLIQPDQPLVVGYSMDVRFTVYTQEEALTVPKTAVFDDADGDYVWVLRDGVIERQQVTKGIETRDGCVIAGGIAPGDIVVTDADNAALSHGKRAKTAA